MNDVFEPADQHTTNSRISLLKSNQPLPKADRGHKSLSYTVRKISKK